MNADTVTPLRLAIHVPAYRPTKQMLYALRGALESFPGTTPSVIVVDGKGEQGIVETRYQVDACPDLWNCLAAMDVRRVDLLDSSEAGC